MVQPGINSIKDLKGKKIAVTLNSGAEITLYYLLKDAGLALGDVRVVPMAANEMVAAFANKNIDAYCVWEPAFSDGQKAVAGSKVLATDKDTPIYRKFKTASAPDVVVIRKDLVDKHPETAKKLIAAYFKGVKLTKENPGRPRSRPTSGSSAVWTGPRRVSGSSRTSTPVSSGSTSTNCSGTSRW